MKSSTEEGLMYTTRAAANFEEALDSQNAVTLATRLWSPTPVICVLAPLTTFLNCAGHVVQKGRISVDDLRRI
jgi:hypothetical protein